MSGFSNTVLGGASKLIRSAIRSPNYVLGSTGWTVNKDGSAEFNNLTVRGTFAGLDFEINNNGAFFYNGTPALGNLKISIASNGGGTDRFGNVYVDNVTSYNVTGGGGYAQMAANPSTGIPYLVVNPPGLANASAPPQINASTFNAGSPSEFAQLNMTSGYEVGPGAAGAAFVQLVSRADNSTTKSIAGISADILRGVPQDGNNYSLGRFCARTVSTITINSASPQTILSIPVIAQAYRVRIHLVMLSAASTMTSVIAFNTGSATCSNCIGTDRRGRASTSADVVRPINGNGYPAGNSLALAASELTTYEFEGVITFSGAGNFLIVGTTSASSYAIAINSYVELLNIQ